MARLRNEHKIFIIHQLARFSTPSEVVKAVLEEYGVEINRYQAQTYDPTKAAGADLAKKWRAMFDAERKKFIEDTSELATSHKVVRVQRLERMSAAAEKKGNFVLAAALLEQIAKEMGEAYTNRHKFELAGPGGGPVEHVTLNRSEYAEVRKAMMESDDC